MIFVFYKKMKMFRVYVNLLEGNEFWMDAAWCDLMLADVDFN